MIKKVRNDLKYGSGPTPGDVSKCLKRWNKIFRVQGFHAWLELPSEEGAEELGRSTAGMNKEDQKQAQKEAKRFRIVISPMDNKGGSIYSRSSLRGSVAGEGGFVKKTTTMISNITKGSHSVEEEGDAKEEDEEKQEDVKSEIAKAEANVQNGQIYRDDKPVGKENGKEVAED